MKDGLMLGTEFRAVHDVEYEGKAARAVDGTRFYTTEPADLWDALTNPERLPRWFSAVRGDLELDGRFQIEGNAEGTIKKCDPPDTLELTWEFGGNVSWVSVRLLPEGTGTRMTLVHTMLKDEASESHWATYGPGATGVGWDLAFMGLGLHVAHDGKTVDPAAHDAWLASETGKGFLRSCAEAWGRAHIAAGGPEQVAGAMATRTASFYTGE